MNLSILLRKGGKGEKQEEKEGVETENYIMTIASSYHSWCGKGLGVVFAILQGRKWPQLEH